MQTQTIPLSKLIPSPVNVRKTGGQSIDDLAASIEAHGLIQSLTVKPAAKGKFEVVAGGRRLAALTRLLKEKRTAQGVAVTKDFAVLCRVLDGEDAVEISLAENAIRQAMHPADQFDAFKALADGGASPANIADRFGATSKFVEQRLKLARVSPKLMKAYRDGEMTLEHLEAFTVNDDHKKQESVWKAVKGQYGLHAHGIRRMLTDEKPALGRGTARLITAGEYEAAGGTITRDLFSKDDEGWFDDPALLERLIAAKLEEEAEAVRQQGWAWVAVFPDGFNSWQHGYGTHPGIDELPEGADVPAEIKVASGCAVFPTWQGTIAVEIALVRDAQESDDPDDGGFAAPLPPTTPEAPKAKPEFSASLLEELTAHRTQGMRVAMAQDRRVAFDALLYSLAVREFCHGSRDGLCVQITAERRPMTLHGGNKMADTEAHHAFEDMRSRWADLVPGDAAALWDWLRAEDQYTKDELLAFLVATALDVTQPRGNPAKVHSHALHEALGLDMADWWTPTADSYLSRVSKDKVIDALAEAGEPAVNLAAFAAMKKARLVADAEKALDGKRWLPKPLRGPEPEATPAAEKEAA